MIKTPDSFTDSPTQTDNKVFSEHSGALITTEQKLSQLDTSSRVIAVPLIDIFFTAIANHWHLQQYLEFSNYPESCSTTELLDAFLKSKMFKKKAGLYVTHIQLKPDIFTHTSEKNTKHQIKLNFFSFRSININIVFAFVKCQYKEREHFHVFFLLLSSKSHLYIH